MGDVYNLKIAVTEFTDREVFSLRQKIAGKSGTPAFLAVDTSEACIRHPSQAVDRERLFLETLVRECHNRGIPILPLKSDAYPAKTLYEEAPEGLGSRFAETAGDYFERVLQAGVFFSKMLEPDRYGAIIRPEAHDLFYWQVARLGLVTDTLFDFDIDAPDAESETEADIKDLFDFVCAIQRGDPTTKLGRQDLDTGQFKAMSAYLAKGISEIGAVQKRDQEQGDYQLVNV